MGQMFGVVFVCVITLLGFSSFKNGINKRRLVRDPYVREVQGTIVDYVERVRGGYPRHVRLYPIYEYYYNGATHTYRCGRWMSGVRRIGEKKTLYLDTRDNKVFEKGEIGLELYLGIMFGGVGVFLFIMFLMGLSR